MNSNETKAGISPVLSTAGLCVGGRVKLLKSIYDHGEDHHQPGWLAHAGEVLIVKAVRGDVLSVAHEGNPGAFVLYPGEYETHNQEMTMADSGRPLYATVEFAVAIAAPTIVILNLMGVL